MIKDEADWRISRVHPWDIDRTHLCLLEASVRCDLDLKMMYKIGLYFQDCVLLGSGESNKW